MSAKEYLDDAGAQILIQQIKKKIAGGGYNWTNSTDAEIVEAIQKLDNGTITVDDLCWDVGDERVVHLNAISAGSYNVAHAAQDIKLVILDVSSYNGVGHYIVGFKDCLNEMETMETSKTNQNGWHNSRGRKACDAIFNMFPSSISSIFKTFTVTTATKGGSATPGVTTRSGKLALPAEKEIFGQRSVWGGCESEYTSANVHSQFEWFKTTANRIKKVGSSYYNWWERSPCSWNNETFLYVKLEDGDEWLAEASASGGFAPFGVI